MYMCKYTVNKVVLVLLHLRLITLHGVRSKSLKKETIVTSIIAEK